MVRRLLLTLSTALTLALLGAEAAFAQREDVGRNFSDWLREQAEWLWLAVAAAGAVFFMVSKRRSELFVFLAVVVIAGFVIVSPDGVRGFVNDLADRVLGQ
jgi:cell division protein FtsW (lipid II flippase)